MEQPIEVIDGEGVNGDRDGRGSSGPDSERKSRKRFNPNLDVILLREVGARQPYAAPHGKVNETWEEVTDALNNSGSFPWKVDSRMARDRFLILERWLKKHDLDNLRRGAGEVFELREHLLSDIVNRKDTFAMAKEERRDGKRDSFGGFDRKRGYIGDPDDPDAKRVRDMQSLNQFVSYLKEKDSAANEMQRKKIDLDEIRLQAEIEDRRKQREIEEKKLQLEETKLSQQAEDKKLLNQILQMLQSIKGDVEAK
ncbi:hypothetical protein NDN08_001247 [Rhodosorus marinus]|uniref:Myb-like domain-containing protein n=1 Tax=Rhodosorus marinus TaxID=101924 RepID=A0AAV8UQ78_9RHOD|nr:hypothetical protein NDN08_001247 [Rhodosorus marinus]